MNHSMMRPGRRFTRRITPTRTPIVALWLILALSSAAPAQQTLPARDRRADELLLGALATALTGAYPNRDATGLGPFLDAKVEVVLPDGSVLRGKEAVIKHFQTYKTRSANGRWTISSTDGEAQPSQFYGDVALISGSTAEIVTDEAGKERGVTAPFTAVAIKSEDGPAITGGWVVRSFHSSMNSLDNPVVTEAIRAAAEPDLKRIEEASLSSRRRGGIEGLLAGLFVGFVSGAGGTYFQVKRRRSA
jgi:ketosteroid isomerase-like protein